MDATIVNYQDLAGNIMCKSGITYSQKKLFGIAQQNIWPKKPPKTQKQTTIKKQQKKPTKNQQQQNKKQ